MTALVASEKALYTDETVGPFEGYRDGMWWTATTAGIVAGFVVIPGDRVYVVATEPGLQYLVDVTFRVERRLDDPGVGVAVVAAPPRWSMVVVRDAGGEEFELADARARTMTFRVDGAADASVQIDGESEAAGKIVPKQSDMIATRNGVDLFRGKILDAVPALSADRHEWQIPALDYRGLLDEVARVPAGGATFDDVDQAAIAWALIDAYQNRPGGDRGITNGLGSVSGKLRDRTFDEGAPIGRLIEEMGRVIEGFEWEISPALEFNRWYPRRGRAAVTVLDFGGRIASANRGSSGDFGNAWTIQGGGDTASASSISSTVATDPRGRWERSQAFSSIQEQATLQDRADWLRGQSETPRSEWTLTFERGAWDGPDDLWIGDTFTLSIDRPTLQVEALYRVAALQISLGQSDASELVTIGAIAE